MSCYELLSSTDVGGTRCDTFRATEHTLSPWGPIQHGGPVAALLTRSMDRCAPREGTRIGRVSVEILGPVPIGQVRVSASIERPGRRIELLSSRLEAQTPDGDWRAAAVGRAWRLATQDTPDIVHHPDSSVQMPTGPDNDADIDALPREWRVGGFVSALEWRRQDMSRRPGEPSVAWMRLVPPLVAGEPTTALEQAVAIADVANGIGARLDPSEFSFLNTDLTVQLYQAPQGPWFGLRAETATGPDGIGLSAGTLHDATGTLGRVSQTVLVERRTVRV